MAAGIQTDLDDQGIAKNARQEKLRARAERLNEQQENERLAALYRQHILKEAPPPPLTQIQGLRKSEKPEPVGTH